MKIKILALAFITIIGFQAHSQLAYDVLIIDNLIHPKTEKNHLNVSLAMDLSATPTAFKLKKLDEGLTAQLQAQEQANLPLYLSSSSLKKHTAQKKTFASPTFTKSLILPFYRTPENIFIEWLKPVDYDFQNLLGILNIPKGFGPLFKI